MLRKRTLAVVAALLFSLPALAEEYVIDTKDAHAFIQFRIQHLGFSWLYGRFNTFEGRFSYDEKDPAAASVEVTIDTASVDSNHAERDKHLRGGEFFDVKRHPTARFVSTGYEPSGEKRGVLHGNLTFRGITKPVAIEVTHMAADFDPWFNFRRGFYGTTKLSLEDYGIYFNLGPHGKEVELMLSVEGVRQ